MKLIVGLASFSALFALLGATCLKEWDFTLAFSENMLNEAIDRVVYNKLRTYILPPFEKEEVEMETDELREINKASIEGLKIERLLLRSTEAQNHEGKIDVTFSEGQLNVTKEIDVFQLPNPIVKEAKVLPFEGKTMTFRVTVTSYKIGLENTDGDEYSLSLEIVGDDAIVGELVWDIGMVSYTDLVRTAITEKMKRTLKDGNLFNLGTFQVPKRHGGQSLVKDIFPEQIRFAFAYDPEGRSVLAALGSNDKDHVPPEKAFSWATDELLPVGDLAMTISGEIFMESLKPTIAPNLHISPDDLVSHGCNGGSSTLQLSHRKNKVFDGADLVSMTMSTYAQNELKIDMNLWKHVSPGIDVDIYVRVKVALTYNHNTRQFDVTQTYQGHHEKYHKDWWVVILEWITLGIAKLVTTIIESIANQRIAQALASTLNFNPDNGGIPINIDGVVGEVVDRMRVDSVMWHEGNFVFPFKIYW